MPTRMRITAEMMTQVITARTTMLRYPERAEPVADQQPPGPRPASAVMATAAQKARSFHLGSVHP